MRWGNPAGQGRKLGVLSSPGYKRDSSAEEESTPLELREARAFRALAVRANFLCMDRPDIAFAATECCRRMSAPRSEDVRALERVASYLRGRPRLVYRFPWQQGEQPAHAYVDTDFAGCLITRRSTSGGLCLLGKHLIKHWSATQKRSP